MSIWRAAKEIGRRLGPRRADGRILHVTDLHNSPSGFLFAKALADAVDPDVVVCTGDLSGLGPFFERPLLRILWRIRRPTVLALGNHDSAGTVNEFHRISAECLDAPRMVEVAGVRFWGFRDPNQSPLFGPPYDPDLCRKAAADTPPPSSGPYVIAVHNELMVGQVPEDVNLVLCGHFHSHRSWRRNGALFLRSGSVSGGGPFGTSRQASVIDLWLPSQEIATAWRIEESPDGLEVNVIAAGHAEA